MRTLIIDDEEKAIQALENIINLFSLELNVIGRATSVKSAIGFLSNNEVDLVFLDVELRDGLGTEVLEHFPNRKFETIFVTGYDQYAVNAFKLNAYNYLLKPVDPDELKLVIERLLNGKKPDQPEKDSLMVPTSDGIIILKLSSIIRLQSDNNYTHIILEEQKKILVTKTLKRFEDSLSSPDFIRVHQSHIVNFTKITGYSKKEGGILQMSNSDRVPVSKKYKHIVESIFHLRFDSI
ncbi:MAG: DNA-binding response regulator [Crocinitomicaceae bacterium]|nr:DNA-binding response regulator [Crocinitomicaceae bacterium]|tara:strand:+ start:16485 stop:17195 length:711 start_codon:yes stop_codon:yes gene_type:complete